MLTTRSRLLLVLPLALVLVPFLLWPMVYGFALTFTNVGPYQVSPRFIGLSNYVNALGDNVFHTALINMVVFTTVTVLIEMVLGMVIALGLYEPFRGRALLRTVLLLPWLLSPSASGVMWHQLLNNQSGLPAYWTTLLRLPSLPYALGLDTSYWTVMFTEIWRKVPLVTFLMLPGLLAIPAVRWDQAKVDGLPLISRIRHIVLPHLRLLLLTITLLIVGDALGMSESVYFLTGGGPGARTMTPGVYSYSQAIIAQNWTAGGTAGWFIVGAVLILGLVYLRLSLRLRHELSPN